MRTMIVSLLSKVLLTAAALFLLTGPETAFADWECARSCSLRCQQLVTDFEQIAADHRAYCDGGEIECVPNCERRYSDGSCRQYGQDFCARNAVCQAKCQRRYSDGSCREYGADVCGSAPLSCVRQCVARYSDGSCREYGEDICGRNPSCVPSCTDRWSDGSCRTYGPDRCID